MLQITNTVINKDAQAIVNKIVYAIHYIVSNNELTSIQCAISSDTDGNFEQIGFIRKEGGRLNTDFIETISPIDHLTQFEKLLKEVEADAMGEPKMVAK